MTVTNVSCYLSLKQYVVKVGLVFVISYIEKNIYIEKINLLCYILSSDKCKIFGWLNIAILQNCNGLYQNILQKLFHGL